MSSILLQKLVIQNNIYEMVRFYHWKEQWITGDYIRTQIEIFLNQIESKYVPDEFSRDYCLSFGDNSEFHIEHIDTILHWLIQTGYLLVSANNYHINSCFNHIINEYKHKNPELFNSDAIHIQITKFEEELKKEFIDDGNFYY